MKGFKKLNGYACSIPEKLYRDTPKAVFAAIAISALTGGGDWIEEAEHRVLYEWTCLYRNAIVPQRPPREIDSEISAEGGGDESED